MTTLNTPKVISINDLWNFFNHLASFFCILGYDGFIRDINPAFSNILGYEEDELLSKKFVEFIYVDDQKIFSRHMKKMQGGGEGGSFKYRILKNSGDVRWIAFNISSSADDESIYCTGEDITEKIEREEEMMRLALVAKKTKHGITITDKKRKIIWVNEGFTNMTGYTLEEVVGKNPLAVLGGPLTATDSKAFINELIEKQQPFFRETINYKKSGEPFWIRVEGQPIFDEKGELTKWISIQTDISGQKTAEESILASEKKYRSLFNNSPLFNFIFDPETLEILEVNSAAINHYGYSLGEFIHLLITDIKCMESGDEMEQMLKEVGQGTFHGICRHKKKSGEIITVDATASMLEYRNKNAVLLVIKDISEKIKLEEELMNEKVNKEKNILEATIIGQEMERIEIGKELHDNINQMLGTVKLYNQMALTDKKRNAEYINTGTEILLATINEVRALSKSLVASQIEELDLFEALHDLVDTITNGKNIHIQLFIDEYDLVFPYKLKLMLFRIVQEQLNNILKHANANVVNIQLLNAGGNIKLRIHDDGQGFDTNEKKQGIGLSNIRNRVKMYNGNMKIISSPGEGCMLEINVGSNEILKLAV